MTDVADLYREAARLARATDGGPAGWQELAAEASRLAALGRAGLDAWGDVMPADERLAAVAAREAYLGTLTANLARAQARRAELEARRAATVTLLRVLWGELVARLVWGERA